MDKRFGSVAVPGPDGVKSPADIRGAGNREGYCETPALVDGTVGEGEWIKRRCTTRRRTVEPCESLASSLVRDLPEPTGSRLF